MSLLSKTMSSDAKDPTELCRPVHDLSKALAVAYLLPGETIHFALQSPKEEFAFTNHALVTVVGAAAITTRRLVTRYEYTACKFRDVRFETAGRVVQSPGRLGIEREVEIKFHIGGVYVSIDVAKDDAATARLYYKVLALLSHEQQRNALNWEWAKTAMEKATGTLRVGEASGVTLTAQLDEALTWMQTIHTKYNPSCYRDVIVQAFEQVQKQ